MFGVLFKNFLAFLAGVVFLLERGWAVRRRLEVDSQGVAVSSGPIMKQSKVSIGV